MIGAQAAFSRDTLSKALYSKMFDFLVLKVNESIRRPNFDGIMIGVLDIYGFEIFDVSVITCCSRAVLTVWCCLP